MNEQEKYIAVQNMLDDVSPSFCLAKWHQTTLYLQNGYNHSCHHPSPHKIPMEELKNNFKALHNTQHKKEQMKMMLQGKRPPECEYCWKAEDAGHISDRVYKSGTSWAKPKIEEVLKTGTGDVNPAYLEIIFSNVCNFKCAYCAPDLSSKWFEEIKSHGPYPTSERFNNFEWFEKEGKMPINHRDYNPYVKAFWEWWPELYDNLHTLRLSGGEPLLSKDVWKMIDYIESNPNKDLVFAINTNLCVEDTFVDRIIEKTNTISKNTREFQFFTSGEAVGACGEYIRDGLDYKKWTANLERVLDSTDVIVAIMTTVNLTSVTTYVDFIRYLLELRGKYNKNASFNKVQFMTNTLRFPEFLSLRLLDEKTKQKFTREVSQLIQEKGVWDGYDTLTYAEADQLKRMIDYMNLEYEPSRLKILRNDFVRFIDEYDIRRNKNFKQTFSELEEFYNLCKGL